MERSPTQVKADEKRAEKLAEIEKLVRDGSLIVRKATPQELARLRKQSAHKARRPLTASAVVEVAAE